MENLLQVLFMLVQLGICQQTQFAKPETDKVISIIVCPLEISGNNNPKKQEQNSDPIAPERKT